MAAFQSSEPSECDRVWIFSASHAGSRGNAAATTTRGKRARFGDAADSERHVAVQGV
jgi:hypothetical protein